ncbi:MAG: BatD family protein, partial [Pseudomonadales bacterium]|nr:BatD family protein [Pseudomonadales bacterium]
MARIQTGNRYSLVLLILIAFGTFSQLAQASLTTSVDRRKVTDADILTLRIRLDNSTATPDFSAIEQDFTILRTLGPNRSSRTTIINGNTTSEVYTEWVLQIRPKKLGELQIPALTADGFRSSPIPVSVTRRSAQDQQRINQYVFFDTTVDTEKVYVQGQIIYTIKLYYVDSISGQFPPEPKIDDAIIETVEAEKRYDAIVKNRRFYVLEKSYAIYPQHNGKLTIPGEVFYG